MPDAAGIAPDLIARAHASFIEDARLLARLSPRGAIEEEDGLVLLLTGFPTGSQNYAIVTSPPADPAATLRKARRFFASVPWRLWAWGDTSAALEPALKAEGFASRPAEPGMLLAPLPAEAPPLPPGLSVEAVTDARRIETFNDTFAASFGMPRDGIALVYNAGLLDVPDATLFLGRVDGAPAAMALGLMSHRIAAVVAIGVLAPYRRRGFGEAMTWLAALQGRSNCLAAYLTASALGFPVYRRMGFRHVVDYQRWAD
ncbi:MAG: GNAT family N-acetyltransferase [Dehalococcoidia bacterium]